MSAENPKTIETQKPHESLGSRIGELFHKNNYHLVPGSNSLEDILPGVVPGFKDLINNHGIIGFEEDEWTKVAEQVSEISATKLKLFGPLDKLEPFANELIKNYDAAPLTPLIDYGMTNGVAMAMVTMKITDQDVLDRKY